MSLHLSFSESNWEFTRQVNELSGHNVADCYQCGKCTAGCPIAYAMDYPPHVIMRAVQLGMRDLALNSRTIWLCASCETCSTRCPQEADPAGTMDVLRRIAHAEGIRSPEQNIPLFHRVFLGTVRQFGRVFEVGLMGIYNVLSGHLLKDVSMAPQLLLAGKLSLLPPRTGAREVNELFARASKVEAEREHRRAAARAAAAKKLHEPVDPVEPSNDDARRETVPSCETGVVGLANERR